LDELGKQTADKTKYMIMSRDQNAGRSHSMKTDNISIERVEDFKYLYSFKKKKIVIFRLVMSAKTFEFTNY